MKKDEKTESPSKDQSPQKNNMFSLEMTKDERELLKLAHETQPIAKDGKSQIQRVNMNAPKKTKGSKAKTAKKGNTKAGKKTSPDHTPSTPKKIFKRPSAAIPRHDDEDVEEKEEEDKELRKKIPENTIKEAMERARYLATQNLPRSVRRCRTTSKAYHVCEVHLQKQNMTKEEAQAVGRLAGRLAGAEFDKEWPLEKAKSVKPEKSAKSKPAETKKKKTGEETDRETTNNQETQDGDDGQRGEDID